LAETSKIEDRDASEWAKQLDAAPGP